MTPPDLDALVRDIEMTYEMLFAFLAIHADADTDLAWADARDQVRNAITRALPRRSAD